MAGWNFFSSKKDKSKDVAKQRLQLVLIQDKGKLPGELMEQIKDDILKTLSKYIEVDDSFMDFELTKVENEPGQFVSALVANIPIKTLK